MKNNNGWVSEYQRRKFLDRQEAKRRAKWNRTPHYEQLEFKVPKCIAVMLDLDGTSDHIDDEKARIFTGQLEVLRKKFDAEVGYISISTHYNDTYKMEKVLDIIARNLQGKIAIGTSFFYEGVYDYSKKESITIHPSFNIDKIKMFTAYYLDKSDLNTCWLACFDDNLSDDIYIRFQNRYPALIGMPSQSERKTDKNNFMRIATTTKGFDGVLEILSHYAEATKSLTTEEILETQRNMIMHLSSDELEQKIARRDYAFLERYFEEGYADDDDYVDAIYSLIAAHRYRKPTSEECIHLARIFELI